MIVLTNLYANLHIIFRKRDCSVLFLSCCGLCEGVLSPCRADGRALSGLRRRSLRNAVCRVRMCREGLAATDFGQNPLARILRCSKFWPKFSAAEHPRGYSKVLVAVLWTVFYETAGALLRCDGCQITAGEIFP